MEYGVSLHYLQAKKMRKRKISIKPRKQRKDGHRNHFRVRESIMQGEGLTHVLQTTVKHAPVVAMDSSQILLLLPLLAI
ncbi:hypothetical protein QL285_055809 [Trifolium repens]|nr:hypothetical protein QL285_055809 [Trifolium repens]